MKSLITIAMLLGATTASAETKSDTITVTGSSEAKALFVASTATFVGFTAAMFYTSMKFHADVPNIQANKPEPGPITEDDCGRLDVSDKNGVFTSVCHDRDRSVLFRNIALLALPVVAVSGYFAFFHKRTIEKRSIAIVPTVTTQTAGAMLDVRF